MTFKPAAGRGGPSWSRTSPGAWRGQRRRQDLDVQAPDGHQVRGRHRDHLQGRQVRHRAQQLHRRALRRSERTSQPVPRRRRATRVRTRTRTLDGFKAIETPDDNTIVFQLKHPFAEFDFLVAIPQTAPVPQAKDTGVDYEKTVVLDRPVQVRELRGRQAANLVQQPELGRSRPTRPASSCRTRSRCSTSRTPRTSTAACIAGQIQVDLGGTGVQSAARAKIVGDPKLKDPPTTPSRRSTATR